MKELPTYYYLDHFREFLQFVEGPSAHLLNQEQQDWLSQFNQLNKWEQCVIARSANRKHALIKQQSLHYKEIPDSQDHINQLQQLGFLRPVEAQDVTTHMEQLTKPEIVKGLREHSTVKVKSALPKAELLDVALTHIDTVEFAQSE